MEEAKNTSELGTENVPHKQPLKISEALVNVNSIIYMTNSIHNYQPMITAPEQAIHHHVNRDTQFDDSWAYGSAVNKFQDELNRQSNLVSDNYFRLLTELLDFRCLLT